MSNTKEYIGKASVHNIENLETKITIFSDRLRTTIAYIPYKEVRHAQYMHLLSKENATYFGGIFSDTLNIVTETGLEPRELLAQRDALANNVRELLEWAKSVEGHNVSRGITNTNDSIFEVAKNLLTKISTKP